MWMLLSTIRNLRRIYILNILTRSLLWYARIFSTIFNKDGWHFRRKGIDTVYNYVFGGQIQYNQPWVDVDYVYMPMNIESLEH